MRIAVVDDEEMVLKEVRAEVELLASRKSAALEAAYYSRGELLLYDLQEQKTFDVYLLDIEMDGLDGMALAARIREEQTGAYLVFLTSHPEFALEGYEVHAYHYILKSRMREKLPGILEALYREIARDQQSVFTIQNGSRCVKILCREICYIYKEGKNAVLVTESGKTAVRMTLQEVYEKLPPGEFLFADRGCLVNIRQIWMYRNREVILQSGETIPVSRSRIGAVRSEIGKYWRDRI